MDTRADSPKQTMVTVTLLGTSRNTRMYLYPQYIKWNSSDLVATNINELI
jgi:alpha-D-ribose 1-methylphosphonate 5-phosphate C-P lyase